MPGPEERIRRLSPDKQLLLRSRLAGAGWPGGAPGHWAIIGMACRVPGAENVEDFWRLLAAAQDAITEVPPDRWPAGDFYSADQRGPAKTVSPYGGFLADIAEFDAEFFGISAREAIVMDPQQRILLEVAWEALEDAGVVPTSLGGTRTGVFVGISSSDYSWHALSRPELIDVHSGPGVAHSIAANRISYLLDLHGPSVAVDSACSSSLVALHNATSSLAAGESSLAIVGGVNVILSPAGSIAFSRAGAMSPDGRCKAFADSADGMVRSEGCGVVVLKDLQAAVRDGDRIRAVLRGSAVNSDGHTNGLTAPSRSAQEDVIRAALGRAGVAPADVQYVEAHGTGTLLGDAIEASALGTVVGQAAGRAKACSIGSVKSNLGHLEAAAGIVSLIKVVCALEHRLLPPTLHVDRPSRHVAFSQLGLALQSSFSPWPEPERTLMAGVSSFGFGGTNAHVIVTGPPRREPAPPAPSAPPLLTISARSVQDLRSTAVAYQALLGVGGVDSGAVQPGPTAGVVCAAAALRRTHHRHRLAVIGSSDRELAQRLELFLAGEPSREVAWTDQPAGGQLAFVFSGLGQHWSPAGLELLESQPEFATAFGHCRAIFESLGAGPLEPRDPGDPGRHPGPSVRQLWNFAVQVALTKLWQAWGIAPDVVCGHSAGEVAAAYCAGILDLASACRVMAERALALERAPAGRMLAVELDRGELEAGLAAVPGAELVAENGPGSFVLAGAESEIDALAARWKGTRFARVLETTGAGHSSMIEPLAADLAAALGGLRTQAPRIPFVSSVTGEQIADRGLDAAYWGRNLREPIRFGRAVEALLGRGVRRFVEISAVPALVPAISQTAAAHQVAPVVAVPSLRTGRGELDQLLVALSRLYVEGADPAFEALFPGPVRHCELPGQRWHRRRYWLDAPAGALPGHGSASGALDGPWPASSGEQPTEPTEPTANCNEGAGGGRDGEGDDGGGEVDHEIPGAAAWMRTAAEAALCAPAGTLDVGCPLIDLGLDSLMAIELRDAIARGLGIDIPVRSMLEGASVADLCAQVRRGLDERGDRAESAGDASPRPRLKPSGEERDLAELPLSAGQQALWFLQQMAPESTAYNIGEAIRLRGPIDIAALQQAFDRIVARHPSLRSTFHESGPGPIRRVEPPSEDYFDVVQASGTRLDELRSRIGDLVHSRLDLRTGPLFRIIVFTLSDTDHVVCMLVHHLVGDFWSLAIILRELDTLYPALCAQRDAALPAPRLEYQDYVNWQRDVLASPRTAESLAFWRDRLTGAYPAAEIPGRPRPMVPSYRGARITCTVDRDTTSRLHAVASEARATSFAALLGAFEILLGRYCDASTFSIGTLASGRSREEFADLVGYLVNPIVVRADLSGDPCYRDVLARVRTETLEAFEHADIPFPRLVEELRTDHDPSRPPLCQILFVWQRAQALGEHGLTAFGVRDPSAVVRVGGLECQSLDLEHRSAQFDLSLFAAEVDGEIHAAIEYSTDLYQRPFVERLAANFRALLARIASAPEVSVSQLDILSADERRTLSEEWNATEHVFGEPKCVPELVAEQAGRTPDAVAAVVAGDTLTYRQLSDRSTALASRLTELGVGPGSYVGVCDFRSLELMYSLLAVLRAGAAYVPLDPEHPASRIAFQIQDAGIAVILTRSALSGSLAGTGARLILVDEELPGIPDPAGSPTSRATLDEIAYVMYTSGSTGQPKGVAVQHRALVNRLLWMQDKYGLGPADCVIQKTPFTFDVSVWEMFWPVITGARLFFAAPDAHRDPRYLAEAMGAHGVTVAHFVPPMLDLFLAEPAIAGLTGLRQVFCSGDVLRPETVRSFLRMIPAQLHNLYGPTEATIDVTCWQCGPAEVTGSVPIGRPVANTQIYLLDSSRRMVPIGLPGELCVGGVQVAAGYLNRPELTSELFVPNPYSGGRMYRTGDIGRYREDGAIEFMGRRDGQVKLRGFRIEPGEIEFALCSHPGVAQAVVVALDRDTAERHLVAYIRATGPAVPEVAELRRHLADRLPEHMIPAHIVALDRIPISSNGKIDRSALPEPRRQVSAGEGSQARAQTQQEQVLAQAWRRVLGIDHVGLDDSFFALGGDSMLSIRVRTDAEHAGWTFAMEDLFKEPTIRGLATRTRPLGESEPAYPPSAPFSLVRAKDRERLPADLADAYPLTTLQTGMLFHAEYASDTAIYRVVTSVQLGTSFEAAALREAIAAVSRRHPALRTSFNLGAFSEPLQLVHRAVQVPLEVHDICDTDDHAQERIVAEWIESAKRRWFDPAVPPLLVFAAHVRSDESFQLSVAEHHAILDGWSDGIMLAEIVSLYDARRRKGTVDAGSPGTVVAPAFRDFVDAERRVLDSADASRFWSEMLAGAEPAWLPRPSSRAAADQRPDNRARDVMVPSEVSDRLRDLARREGLPLKAVLMAAHVRVLQRVCGTADVVTGVVSNGRLEIPGGDQVLGVFLNTLPIRVNVPGGSWISLARRIFELEQDSYPFRRYPIARIQHDLGRQVPVESYFNFVDFHLDRRLEEGTGVAILGGTGVAETNFPLAANFFVDPVSGQIRLSLDCDVAALGEHLPERLAGYYARALEAVATSPGADFSAASLLGREERERVAGWNATEVGFDGDATIHQLIERQADVRGDAVALVHGWTQMSYAALDAQANQLCRHLRELGVTRRSRVGISLLPGTELVAAILAVLKAGAAYVPMDPEYPPARLEFIAADASLDCLVSDRAHAARLPSRRLVLLDADSGQIAAQPTSRVASGAVSGADPAYVIYTSGSTGQPKGTVVRHRNLVNFFTGMEQEIGCGTEEVVLAVTSVSFDISVLELLWPLARGAKVVIAGDHVARNLSRGAGCENRPLGFSLFFFAAAAQAGQREAYRLVLEAARFADAHGFEAIWTPERHFHEFGGPYPNPSVMAAALATITERIGLRCGSVVAPLHDTLRIAEEWSLVDNLSHGRVGLSFASGWHSNDFVFFPEAYQARKARMLEQLEEFRHLWRGGTARRIGGSGEVVDVRIYPSPVQPEPQLWLTSAGSVETFERAGESGANVLTHLLGQDVAELSQKLDAYRRARQRAGWPGRGRATVMVHTFVLEDAEAAKRIARGPFREYLRRSTELWRTLFASTGVAMPDSVTEDDLDAVLDLAVERYLDRSGLFGSPLTCMDMLRHLSAAGADEVGCLIDFGIDADSVLGSLDSLNELRLAYEREVADAEHTLADLCGRHGVTLAQFTPSLASAIAADPQALASLRSARAILVGGEVFPVGLGRRLLAELGGVRIFNMYGPTEATVWSTIHELDRQRDVDSIPIGRPIANTEILILDPNGHPAPIGVPGELCIGGAGVAKGYLGRPELTAQRFVSHPHGRGTIYRTGDHARWREDGTVEFQGRADRQVKMRGHRVEPDEIENVLSGHPEVRLVAVIAAQRESGAVELVAYVSPRSDTVDHRTENAQVMRWSEVWDGVYSDPPDGDDDTNFAGWLSSFTGEPIPSEEMIEWLDHTATRVARLRSKVIADVGVGAGLLLRKLAPGCDRYIGIDISRAAIDALTARLQPAERWQNVTLAHSGPEYLARLQPQSLDTVVLNSVVQYFPGTSYLDRVLEAAVRAVGSGGAVFVGDVRWADLLPALHASVQLQRSPPLRRLAEIKQATVNGVASEQELCISPDYFRDLPNRIPAVRDVIVEVKRGRTNNELTCFRYDVTIQVGVRADEHPGTGDTARWTDLPGGLTGLERMLAAAPGRLTVSGIPDRRLARPLATAELVSAEADGTAWDVERLLWEVDEDAAIPPEEVAELAARCSREVRLLVASDGRPGAFDAVFLPSEASQ